MGTKKYALLTAVLIAAPIAANAASVTYDFTGIVTGATGNDGSVAIGSIVNGTYTFNLGAANPSQSTGTAGSSTADWASQSYTGSSVGIPKASAYVFSSTAQVGAISYSTSAPSAYDSESDMQGLVNGPGSGSFSAGERQVSASGDLTLSSLIINDINPGLNYLSSGLPVPQASIPTMGNTATGYFISDYNTNSTINYDLTSLTIASPVPLPAAAWLMLSGLGGFGALVGRKRAA